MNTVVELKRVSKGFGKKLIYKDVNFSVESGECIGIIGGNGAGKSVLFQIISGLIPADEGVIEIDGKVLGKDIDYPEGVGILINSPGYIDYCSGLKNLMMLAKIQGKIGEEEVRAAMSLVGLDPDDKTRVKRYSMGMKQKLGIAQAIMEHQKIIILDEPYNALDFNTNKEITRILNELKNQGRTILMTSHQHEYLEKLCDKMYFIEDYRLTEFNDEKKKEYFI